MTRAHLLDHSGAGVDGEVVPVGVGGARFQLVLHLQYSTVQYSTVQYSTVQYNTMMYSAVRYLSDQDHHPRHRGHRGQGHRGGADSRPDRHQDRDTIHITNC